MLFSFLFTFITKIKNNNINLTFISRKNKYRSILYHNYFKYIMKSYIFIFFIIQKIFIKYLKKETKIIIKNTLLIKSLQVDNILELVINIFIFVLNIIFLDILK